MQHLKIRDVIQANLDAIDGKHEHKLIALARGGGDCEYVDERGYRCAIGLVLDPPPPSTLFGPIEDLVELLEFDDLDAAGDLQYAHDQFANRENVHGLCVRSSAPKEWLDKNRGKPWTKARYRSFCLALLAQLDRGEKDAA